MLVINSDVIVLLRNSVVFAWRYVLTMLASMPQNGVCQGTATMLISSTNQYTVVFNIKLRVEKMFISNNFSTTKELIRNLIVIPPWNERATMHVALGGGSLMNRNVATRRGLAIQRKFSPNDWAVSTAKQISSLAIKRRLRILLKTHFHTDV